MRIRNWLAVGILVGAAGGCGSSGRGMGGDDPAIASDKAAINNTRTRYAAAWNESDAGRIADLYADDALVLYPNQPAVSGREEIRKYFQVFFADFVNQDFQLTSSEIEVHGSWAFDRGTYRLKATPRTGVDAIEDHGKYLVILRRQPDRSWRVARDMDNSDKPLTQSARGAS